MKPLCLQENGWNQGSSYCQQDIERQAPHIFSFVQKKKSNDGLEAEDRLSENRGGIGEWARGREDTIHPCHMKISQWNTSICTMHLIFVNKMTGTFTSNYC